MNAARAYPESRRSTAAVTALRAARSAGVSSPLRSQRSSITESTGLMYDAMVDDPMLITASIQNSRSGVPPAGQECCKLLRTPLPIVGRSCLNAGGGGVRGGGGGRRVIGCTLGGRADRGRR